jgi:hypothetical protein
MQAGLIKRLMTLEDIVNLVEEEAPKKSGSYKKKNFKLINEKLQAINNITNFKCWFYNCVVSY